MHVDIAMTNKQHILWRNRSLANSGRQYCFISAWTAVALPTRTKPIPAFWAVSHHSHSPTVVWFKLSYCRSM